MDTAPFGLGILPRSDLLGRVRNRFLYWAAKNVILRTPQRQVEQMIEKLTGAELDVFFMAGPSVPTTTRSSPFPVRVPRAATFPRT